MRALAVPRTNSVCRHVRGSLAGALLPLASAKHSPSRVRCSSLKRVEKSTVTDTDTLPATGPTTLSSLSLEGTLFQRRRRAVLGPLHSSSRRVLPSPSRQPPTEGPFLICRGWG